MYQYNHQENSNGRLVPTLHARSKCWFNDIQRSDSWIGKKTGILIKGSDWFLETYFLPPIFFLNFKHHNIFLFFSRISNALLDTFITLEEAIRSNWYQRECPEDIGTVVFHSGANLIFDTSFLYFQLPCHDAKHVFECSQSANSYWIHCKSS